MLTIATYNVNSVRARLANLKHWLERAQPDIVLLQELKADDAQMPRFELAALGYSLAVVGQPKNNGVAILAKGTIGEVLDHLPGDESDSQARYVEAWVTPAGNERNGLRVASLYLPNGNPVGGDKFAYKLAWMDRLKARAAELLAREEPVVLGGDYNCAPWATDVFDVDAMADDALTQPETRQRYRQLLNQGWRDAFRALDPDRRGYSYWDYKAGRFERDEGLLIDFLMLSPKAADRLESSWIDVTPRGQEKASDHTPVLARLAPPPEGLQAAIAAREQAAAETGS